MDYYQILEIKEDATEEEIKKAYKILVIKFHPDRNPGNSQAEKKFIEVSEAYETLKDPQKKANYDLTRKNPFRLINDFDSMMNKVFNFQHRPRRQNKPAKDLRTTVYISLEKSLLGCWEEIEVISHKHKQTCKECKGSGEAKEIKEITCQFCQGKGKIRQFHENQISIIDCDRCYGRGKIVLGNCEKCNGVGVTNFENKIKIQIPVGVKDGQTLRIKGQGLPADVFGPAGDLMVSVLIENNDQFRREGNDLYQAVSITITDFLLRKKQTIRTPIGEEITFEIPVGAKFGQKVTIIGAGVLDQLTKSKGDMIVSINIILPVKLTPRAEKLIEELAEELNPLK